MCPGLTKHYLYYFRTVVYSYSPQSDYYVLNKKQKAAFLIQLPSSDALYRPDISNCRPAAWSHSNFA